MPLLFPEQLQWGGCISPTAVGYIIAPKPLSAVLAGATGLVKHTITLPQQEITTSSSGLPWIAVNVLGIAEDLHGNGWSEGEGANALLHHVLCGY